MMQTVTTTARLQLSRICVVPLVIHQASFPISVFIHAPCQHTHLHRRSGLNAERDRTSRPGRLIHSNHDRVWRGRQHQGRSAMSAAQLSRSVPSTLTQKPRLSPSILLSHGNPCDVPMSDVMQNWLVARSLSSGCRGIKQSSTLQSQVLGKLMSPPAVQASAKLTPSRSIRVTGRLGRGMNLDIVRKKRCITIWALNYWSMGSQGLMRAFWPVSNRVFFPSYALADNFDRVTQTGRQVWSTVFPLSSWAVY